MTIRIRTKIIVTFAAIFILLSFVGFIAYHNRNLIFRGMLSLERETENLKLFSDLRLALDMAVMPPNDFLITGDPEEKERFRLISDDIEKYFRGLEETAGHKGFDRGIINISRDDFGLLRSRALEIFSMKNPVGDPRGALLMKEMDALGSSIIKNIDRLYVLEQEDMRLQIESAKKVRRRVDMVLLAGAAVSALTVVLVAAYLLRSIIVPILKFKEGANIIGSGDLKHRIEIKDGLEVNLLAEEFNKMAEKLLEANVDLERRIEERTKELNDTNLKLKELSITDGLTGTYNQRHFYVTFEDEIKRSQRYGHRVCLIMCDIDFFKHYNDANGHLEGDNALKEAAACILENVREQDTVARYGGEEFAVIMPETGKEGARKAAERIRLAVYVHDFRNGKSQPGGRLTMSFGVSEFPSDGEEARDIIRKADEALYNAKNRGRNRVEF